MRANHGEAEYSSARILRFNRRSMQLQGICNKRKENSAQGLQSPFRCVSDLPAIMRLRNLIIEEGKIKENQHGPGEAKRRKIEFSDS